MARFLLQNPIAFSATRFDIFQRCPKQFFLRYLLPASHPLDNEAEAVVTQIKQLNLTLEAEQYYLWEIMQASRAYLFGVEERCAEQWYFLTFERVKRMHLMSLHELEKCFENLMRTHWFEQIQQLHETRETMIQLKPVENFNLCGFGVYFGTALMRIEDQTLRLWRLSGQSTEKLMQSNLLNLLYIQTQIAPNVDTFLIHQLSMTAQKTTWGHQRIKAEEFEIQKADLIQTIRQHFTFEIGTEIDSKTFASTPAPWTCRFCRYKNQLCHA